ncbi:hypothetical protein B0O99DRAFT_642407 [Bisporella sp. PMI_857]|nr:hypothetical protein B0O99DRAFT_642407 [Bisporella sp. PMI_857]
MPWLRKLFSQKSEMQARVVSSTANSPVENDFKSLVTRSISAWRSLQPSVYTTKAQMDADIAQYTRLLNSFSTVEDVMKSIYAFWFFQTKESFLKHGKFRKWDPKELDSYVIMPIVEGFCDSKDSFFVSHYWHTQDDPDPQGVDYKEISKTLRREKKQWSYVWTDWTCLPQAPRSETEDKYFEKMLYRVPKLIRECRFAFTYAKFSARLWTIFEWSQIVLFQSSTFNDSGEPRTMPEHFSKDLFLMSQHGVGTLVEARQYEATSKRDAWLLIGWLELHILLLKLIPNPTIRKHLFDELDKPFAGVLHHYDIGMEIDKKNGMVIYQGKIYRFSPTYDVPQEVRPTDLLPRPLPCRDKVVEVLKSPRLATTAAELTENQNAHGPDHDKTMTSS